MSTFAGRFSPSSQQIPHLHRHAEPADGLSHANATNSHNQGSMPCLPEIVRSRRVHLCVKLLASTRRRAVQSPAIRLEVSFETPPMHHGCARDVMPNAARLCPTAWAQASQGSDLANQAADGRYPLHEDRAPHPYPGPCARLADQISHHSRIRAWPQTGPTSFGDASASRCTA